MGEPMASDAALRKKARMIGASDSKSGTRMTANPLKASVFRDLSGQTFKPISERGVKWLKKLKS